ncbi:MAG: hypothetical protein ABEJ57_09540 [Halobacteriaceae archaeon]
MPTRRTITKALLLTAASLAGCSSRDRAKTTTTTATTTLPATVEGPKVRIVDSVLQLSEGVATVSVTVANLGDTGRDTVLAVTLTVEGGDQYSDSNAIRLLRGGTRTIEFDFDVPDDVTREAISYDATLE